MCFVGKAKPSQEQLPLLWRQKIQLLLFVTCQPEVCTTCGEEYVSKEVMGQLLRTAREAALAGVQVDVRTYKVA